ncbi:rhomboid-domain-containing protein, partial [Wilcoxina mikolae CBS 423.85]
MSSAQRLLRPTLFTLLVVGGSLYYAYTYTTPRPSERWFPTVPLAFATVAGIIGINLAVFVAWKIPLPITWRVLNKYFVSVPAIPYSASMLGSAFSHQTLTHLGLNMFVLYSLGTSLCEQIGSGPFLGLYVSGAVVSSLASLAWNVVRQRFGVVSLGASGAISTVVGAYTYLNPDAELYIIFLPFIVLKAKVAVGLMACLETLGIIRGWAVLDHVAHLSGLAWGVAGGWALMKEYKRR